MSLASRTAKSEKGVCKLPLICAPQRPQLVYWRPRLRAEGQQTEELGHRLAKSCSGREKIETNSPSAYCSQKDQQNWLGQFETSRRLLLFFFFKYFFFLLTSSSSLYFFFYSFFLSLSFYLFFLPPPSFSSFFLNSYKWDNKTWNCEKTRAGPKQGASQQMRQWDKFHIATPENSQVIVYLYCYFISLFLHLSFY